ncbi:MAG: hypothetical protein Q8912_09435 [Bacillota bacterium]|nr:hypothetical protein [Bacillota bacterium]
MFGGPLLAGVLSNHYGLNVGFLATGIIGLMGLAWQAGTITYY